MSPATKRNVANIVTRDIREMIHTALSNAGGVAYLTRQADENPKAFMSLVGRIVPQQLEATIRRDLPMMTRDELLAILQAGRARTPAKVIDHDDAAAAVSGMSRNGMDELRLPRRCSDSGGGSGD